MRIQHNIMAMNSYRNLSGNNNALSKNLEKLSSGYRINRAGDDAAGLAISEKMRAQISGLDQAQKNAQSGINLVKTAEGALTEVHDMLNRMTTLATQSANGTYETKDREKLQAEIDALIDEIDRIADNSNFNGTKLLNGDLAETFDTVSSVFSGGATMVADTALTVNSPAVDSAVKTKFEVSLDNVEFDFVAANAANTVGVVVGGTTLVSDALTADADGADLADSIAGNYANGISIDGVTYDVVADGNKLVFTMSTTSADALTPGQAPSFAGNFDVSVTTSAGTYGKILGSVNLATQLVQQGAAAANEVLAAGAMGSAITQGQITDGAAFQIGGQQYVLALTDKTAEKDFASESVTVVDLRDLVEKNATTGELQLKQKSDNGAESFDQAMTRIVDAMGNNEMFSVGMTDDMKLTFQQKSSYDGDVDLTDKKVLSQQFQMGGSVADVTTTNEGEELQLQIGASKEETIGVNIESMKAEALGIKGLDITDVTKANAAIDTIKNAIEKVSVTRGDLGAIQNRLEHTINNLGVMEENIQDAESNIRDTDIAEEMMAYTKNNILIQSAQAMLAQANQVPQGVLQLMG